MRRAFQLGLFILLATAVFAQTSPYGSRTGFGNIVFPGTPDRLSPNPYFHGGAAFPTRLGNTIAGVSPGGRSRGNVVIPYAYPVYVGGYGYGYGYGMDPQAQPAPAQPTVVYAYPPQQQQQAPQVIINQTFVTPGTQPATEPESGTSLYQAPSRAPAEPSAAPAGPKAPVFLIAYADHSVYTAVAYWVEGDTLHYITTEGKHNQASLALIDRKLSQDLNKERDVDFRLPQ